MRWEKTTRPFLRSREFLWQEGHTIRATYEEAEARTIQMFHVYEDCYRETLAIPFVSGRKAEHEKFAGAQDTYTIEALMHDGRRFSPQQAISSEADSRMLSELNM